MHPQRTRTLCSIALFMLTSTMGGCPGSPLLPLFSGYFSDGVTTVVSRDLSGELLFTEQPTPAISADGRFVAFEVRSGSNSEIFMRDRATETSERVSVASDGEPANSISFRPSLSADGRFVAFESWGSSLVPDDTNDTADVYVHDRQTGATIRASVGPNGVNGNGISRQPALSADGHFIAFVSGSKNLVAGDTSGKGGVFLRDLQTGETTRVNVSSAGAPDNGTQNYFNDGPAISADGRFVTYYSSGTNLVADDTNNVNDIFVRDRVNAQTVRVSVSSSGIEADGDCHTAVISADGRIVAFVSAAKNLAPGTEPSANFVYTHDRDADGNGVYDETCDGCRRTDRVPLEPHDLPDDFGIITDLAISGDASTVAYSRTLTNPATTSPEAPSAWDATVWIFNRTTGLNHRVVADSPGMRFEGDSIGFVPITRQVANNSERPALSHSARFVTYGGQFWAAYSASREAVFVEDLRP